MDGTWKGPFSAPPTGMAGLIARTSGKGLGYEAALVAQLEGGRSEATGGTLNITNADAVTLVVAIATSFVNYHDISGDPAARCKKVLDAVAGKTFATLRQRHVDDFRSLMSRVHLQIGDAAQNEKPTDERIKAVRDGGADANLEALAFQFGRYILASSSRSGGQPANLQGIWDEAILPPWGSKYTVNINLQMNYWPAEVCNLTECTPPLFELIKDLSETGAKTAKDLLQLRRLDGASQHRSLARHGAGGRREVRHVARRRRVAVPAYLGTLFVHRRRKLSPRKLSADARRRPISARTAG